MLLAGIQPSFQFFDPAPRIGKIDSRDYYSINPSVQAVINLDRNENHNDEQSTVEDHMKQNICLNIGIMATVAMLAGGCAAMGVSQSRRSTNMSAFLYSDSTGQVDAVSIPVLSQPLQMAIAFVPVDVSTNRNFFYANAGPNYANAGVSSADGGVNYSYMVAQPLSEIEKLALMKQISMQFGQYPSLQSAKAIPADYLVPRGGFANLDRIQALYGVDVMILLSYDQVQFKDEGIATLSYWTIVGAYVVPGEKIDTRTVLEAAVYDISSRKLLFRATGSGEVKGSATPVNLSEQLRVDSQKSLQLAATNLVSNLIVEMKGFEKRVSTAPAEYKIERKPGSSGGLFGEQE